MDPGLGFNDYNLMFQDNFSFSQQAVIPEFEEEEQEGPILSFLAEFISEMILFVVLCMVISSFGTVANVINMVVYYRQGVLSCGSNLNLFSLAVADLGLSFTTFLHGAGYVVVLADIPNLFWDPFAIVYLAIGWPGMMFTTANRLLTAYVAFERCLCVVIPFRVKSMFTIRRSLFYITTIYAYTILSHIPIYIIHRFGFEMQENTNISKLVLFYTADREFVHSIVFYANYFVVSISTVAIVFVCTMITGTQLRTSKEWRKSVSRVSGHTHMTTTTTTASTNKEEFSSDNCENSKDKKITDEVIDKETRLVKIITTVSIVYFLCYVPDIVLIVVKSVDDRVRLNGSYYRLAKLMYGFTFVFTAVNCSVNIFIYYRMSSRYRKEFRKLFGISRSSES